MKSWVDSANDEHTDFPLANLPYGVFSVDGDRPRCGAAIGDRIVDLAACETAGLIDSNNTFDQGSLNAFMALGPRRWAEVRERLTALLSEDGRPDMPTVAAGRACMHMPFQVTEYTDFYSSRQHAFNVGSLFRGPDNALPPNWLHIPIGYNGRASSVVISGTDIRRPAGQLKREQGPEFAPCEKLDFELELGAVVGTSSPMGERISVEQAEDMIFGYVLLNDWSARDIQTWEYQPLGPFQAKAFATTISPWVVTSAALAPFRRPTPRPERALLPYLQPLRPGLFDITLEVDLNGTSLCQTNYDVMYYSSAQQLAHHSSSGCPMRCGDLLGSGTISGANAGTLGSLLEMTQGGAQPLTLDDQSQRTFLEDGDRVTFSGHAQGHGHRIGFGRCLGTIRPAQAE